MLGEGNVTLMVDDLERSIRFYQEALGLTVHVRIGDETAEFAGGGLTLRIHRRRREITETGSGTSAVGFRVTDLPHEVQRLTGLGIRIGRILPSGPRRIALFDDPDANHLYLYETLSDPPGGSTHDPRGDPRPAT